jgi:hypothetical protein
MAKKATVKRAVVKKAVAKKAVAKKAVVKRAAAKKIVTKQAAAKQTAVKKPTLRKTAAGAGAGKKPGMARKRTVVRKPASTPVTTSVSVDAPLKHITPEEAVAHIQALLAAKSDHPPQTSAWPEAGAAAASTVASTAAPAVAPTPAAGDGTQTDLPRDDPGKPGN